MLRAYYFPAPTFYNTTSYSARSRPPLTFASRLGFASLGTPAMAQPGIPIFPTPFGGDHSTTLSTADSEQHYRFIYRWLHSTRELIGVSAHDFPIPTPADIAEMSSGEATAFPILCSILHAVITTNTVVKELGTRIHDLESLIANTLPSDGEHLRQLHIIQSNLRDLSHRVAHQTPAQAPTRPPPPPPPPATRQAPAPPRVPPTPERPSYTHAAQPGLVIHGGTSKLVAAAPANRAAHNRKKKGPSPATSVTKVVEGVREAFPQRPPPLSNAARRFFAPHQTPAPHPDSQAIRAHFPDIAASVLPEANCTLPRAFRAVVNERGSVTLTVSNNSVSAASFAHFFEALINRLK